MITRHYNTNEDRNLLGTNPYFLPFIRSSRSVASDEKDTASISLHSVRSSHEKLESSPSATWMPYTFRPYFMWSLSLITLSLGFVTFLLWWRSSTNYGLGADNGSSALLFGWRYSPTMLAVLYIQLTTMLFDDVKRTEPYAHLAKRDGAKASTSILKAPGPWWVALYDGFSKKRNGARSWVLICAALLNVLGFLVISPLSSAYLYSEEIVIPHPTDFLRLSPLENSPLPIDADRSTHFRAIANLLQNVSTSPWITDEYTILPFWPSGLKEASVGTLPTDSSQQWKGETTMFKTDLQCEKMSVESQTLSNMKLSSMNRESNSSVQVVWSGSNGCKYGLEVDTEFFEMGGSSWSSSSTFLCGLDPLYVGTESTGSNKTAECDGHEILIATESWKSKPGTYVAQMCETKYYMANITATVALDGNEPEVSYDQGEFERKKIAIPDSLVNTTQFRDLALNPDWATYMISLIWSRTALMGGGSVLLGALYNYNLTELVHDPHLITSAAKAKQRYFGEVLQASLNQNGVSRRTSMPGTIHTIQTRVVVQAGPAIALGCLFAHSFVLLLAVWWLSRLQRRPLNLKRDPTTAVGVAYLVSQNSRTNSGFRAIKQPSAKDLQNMLGEEYFYTDSHGLSKVSTKNIQGHNTEQSQNGTPGLLRLAGLLGLTISLVVMVVGVAVLYHYAEDSRLYGKAFIYNVKISFLGSGMSSVAPFSMIPTVLATLLGLWWSAIDDNFRRLQPYLSMAKHESPYRKGVDLSYQTTYWFWAAVKAVMNKHWLLFFVTLGSTLSPIFTTSMSALFDRSTGNIIQPINLHRQLEVRNIPFVFSTKQTLYPNMLSDYTADILSGLYKNISSYWMYTATIQLALNGSEPAWSKDGWSFVPLDLKDVNAAKSLSIIGATEADNLDQQPQTNVTFNTPAIRGRIECSTPPVEAMRNISNWLTTTNLTDPQIYNQSTVPAGLQGGYRLGNTRPNRDQYPGLITPLLLSQNWTECPGCTTMFVNPSAIKCCGNSSSNSQQQSVALGYWSPNSDNLRTSPRDWQRNFTVKWIHGDAFPDIKSRNDTPTGLAAGDPYMLFTLPPSISLLNCKPIVEEANAKITVNPIDGEIQSFNLTTKPKPVEEPWKDNFLAHNDSISDIDEGFTFFNVTLSYGRLFTTTMLTSADTLHLSGAEHVGGYTNEDLKDNSYNIRDEMNGLNMDFMSYSMYAMANKNPAALTDMETFTRLAEKTYTTFFQHFVSKNISTETGGWAYQKINASLPKDLPPIVELSNSYTPSMKASAYQDNMHPISHTNRTATAHVSQRVELLQMNATAVWLSIGIMGWLIITVTVIALLQRRYFGSLVRNVECLGDVLVLIAGSANFLQVVREIQAGTLLPSEYENLRTRLGWFVDEDGGLRWGIEMEESFRDGPGVHWVSAPQFSEKGGKNTWGVGEGERHV
ncbi:hypothetical protein N7492_008921 [Penicillium capsulatum]|uniref:Uncharacterized protein n=1 Tax=Penicillium capsulatum TaxID=69766 RepID=A0A9W9LHE9_9EURO|nr:hypothetical protein N7492_008921 [Penicillium capsulatum]KAJ6106321.1 hypothetical protein N7512_009838 [Penicillium capsulatum]